MPGMDRTGPRGVGPLTGWGRGPCGGGRAFGRGLGRGFGAWQRWNSGEPVPGTGLWARLEALEEEVARLRENPKAEE